MSATDTFPFDSTVSRHLDLNSAVFHRSAVALQADGSSFGDGEAGFEQLAIAGAASSPFLDDDLDLLPVLGLVLVQFLVGASYQVVPTLKLRPADEDTAIGVDAGSEFEFED